MKCPEVYQVLEKYIIKLAEIFDGFHFDSNSVDFSEETS